MFKQGEGFAIFTCKAKSTRNPLYKWTVGHGAINQFAFSPCGNLLAVASQDGYLRVFNYHSMELIGLTRSYFGGFTCLDWSPDGKLIACGGEDDLISVYSVAENKILARGQGHRSWVSHVAFDPYNISYGDVPDGLDFSGSDEEGSVSSSPMVNGRYYSPSSRKLENNSSDHVTCYRLGSVGEDAFLCLWDLTEDLLKTSSSSSSSSSQQDSGTWKVGIHHNSHVTGNSSFSVNASTSVDNGNSNHTTTTSAATNTSSSSSSSTSLTQRLASLNFGDKNKDHKRNFSLTGRINSSHHSDSKNSSNASSGSAHSGLMSNSSASNNSLGNVINNGRLPEYVKLGSPQCPKINQVPLIEPLVCKRISQERLTTLNFLEDCFVVSCQEGIVATWARPGRLVSLANHIINQSTVNAKRNDVNCTGETVRDYIWPVLLTHKTPTEYVTVKFINGVRPSVEQNHTKQCKETGPLGR